MTRRMPQQVQDIDVLLMEYAAGTLSDALSLLAASYVALSPEARRRVYECEAVGGALLCHECAPEPMRASALEQVLHRLDEPKAPEIPKAKAQAVPEAVADYDLPLPLIEFLCARHETVHWRRAGTGFEMIVVPTSCTMTQVRLMRAVPGAKAPAPQSSGMRLVLQGGWVEEAQRHPAGTLLVYEHPLEGAFACRSEGCICLVVDEPAPRHGPWDLLFRLLGR
jgi:putative transcriptional regulator